MGCLYSAIDLAARDGLTADHRLGNSRTQARHKADILNPGVGGHLKVWEVEPCNESETPWLVKRHHDCCIQANLAEPVQGVRPEVGSECFGKHGRV